MSWNTDVSRLLEIGTGPHAVLAKIAATNFPCASILAIEAVQQFATAAQERIKKEELQDRIVVEHKVSEDVELQDFPPDMVFQEVLGSICQRRRCSARSAPHCHAKLPAGTTSRLGTGSRWNVFTSRPLCPHRKQHFCLADDQPRLAFIHASDIGRWPGP